MSKKLKKSRNRQAVIEPLEPRILFSVDFLSASMIDHAGPEVDTEISAGTDQEDWIARLGHTDNTSVTESATTDTGVLPISDTAESVTTDSALPVTAPDQVAEGLSSPDNSTTVTTSLASDVNTATTEATDIPGSAPPFDDTRQLEYVIVDPTVTNAEQLIADLRNNTSDNETEWHVVWLRADSSGIDQITDALAQVTGVNAIHFLTHGDGTSLQLGKTVLDAESAETQHSADIWSWGQSLDIDADLLVYGCDLASTDSGRELIDIIADTCGCDVAASDDTTGHADLGGDWVLEYERGVVTTAVAISAAAQNDWHDTLDISSNLLMHHRFNTDANDSSGHNANGTLTNGAVINTDMASNQIGGGKVELDGSNDYVDVSASAADLQLISEGTIAVWLQPQNTSGDSVIFQVADSGDNDSRFAVMRLNNGAIAVQATEGSGPALLNLSTPANTAPANSWIHVAFTASSTANTLYINGSSTGTRIYSDGNPSVPIFFSDIPDLDFVGWGINTWNSNQFGSAFDGFIDDGRVYDRALSAADVSELFNHTSVVVNTTDDTISASANTSSLQALANNNGGGDGVSLREAITAANTQGGSNIINFDIAGSGPHVINVNSALPVITSTLQIDATSDPDYVANGNAPIVVIDGNDLAASGLDFHGTADNSSVSGLLIRDFGENAIAARVGADNIDVTGNYLGSLDTNGNQIPNEESGAATLRIQGAHTTVGGTDSWDRNVISGGLFGIDIDGATDSVIAGNYIGTDANGNSNISYASTGIFLHNGAAHNTVGGPTTNHANVITGHQGSGIQISDEVTDDNIVQNNLIGVAADQNSAPGNDLHGIDVTLGSDTTQILNNVIAASDGDGIRIGSGSLFTAILGNTIGTDASKTLDWGNAINGVHLQSGSTNTTVGGTTAGEGNVIAYNGNPDSTQHAGVSVDDGAKNNSIRGNSIFANYGPGIDLGLLANDGADTNDAFDVDVGGNHKQNWAILHAVNIADSGDMAFTVDVSTLNFETYTIDFYASTSHDHSSAPADQRYLGTYTPITGGSSVLVSHTLSGITLAPGETVTSTITDVFGNTSEFSNYAVATDGDAGDTAPNDLHVISTDNGGLSVNDDGGNDSYLIADDGGSLLGGLSAFTVELQFSSSSSSDTPLFSYRVNNNPNELKFSIYGSQALLTVGGYVITSLSGIDYSTLRDGSEQHLAINWDNTNGDWKIYNKGTLIDSGTGLNTGGTLDGGGTLVFGQLQNNSWFATPFSGTLHDIRLFDDVRSESEIQSSYRSTIQFDEPNLIANWQFDRYTHDEFIADKVSGNNLTVNHVMDSGFTASTPQLTLSLTENQTNGTEVGRVSGIDLEREAQIAFLLATDPGLVYSAYTGKFYKVVTADTSFQTSSTNAASNNLNSIPGQLAIVRSAAENEIIASALSASTGTTAWLGGTDDTTEGEWYWQDGGVNSDRFWLGSGTGANTNNAYHSWWPGDPNNQGGAEDYLAIISPTGQWINVDSTHSDIDAAVVEWDAASVLNTDNALYYTIASQTQTGAFDINATTGVITVADSTLINFEGNPIHTLSVRITDIDGNTYDQNISIVINNLAENSTIANDLSSGIDLNSDGGNATYLLNTNAGTLFDGLESLTVEAVLQISPSAATTESTLLSYASPIGGTDELLITVNHNGEINVSLNGNTTTSANAYSQLLDGKKHSLAVSWDSTAGVITYHIDGVATETTSGFATGTTLSGNGSLVLGNDQDSIASGFQTEQALHATLYDVRIWDHQRTTLDIGLNHQHKLDSGSIPAGLIANWQMGGITDNNQITDIVSGHNLSVENATDSPRFINSTPVISLNVDEASANGTHVGYVVPVDASKTKDIVSDGRFLNATARSYSAGQSAGSWNITSGNVDIGWLAHQAPLGGQAADLGGDSPGTISQTLLTSPGTEYQVSFALSGNFFHNSHLKELRVSAAGEAHEFSITHDPRWSSNNMLWQHRTFSFVADSEQTQLVFKSLSKSGTGGATISDVQIINTPPAVTHLLNNDPSLHYDAGTGKFYKPVTAPATWNQAQAIAGASTLNGVGGQLVNIRSAYENASVLQMVSDASTEYLIGASDLLTEGTWKWIDEGIAKDTFWIGAANGSTPAGSYANFPSTEPNNATNEDYATIRSDGQWNDRHASFSLPYIVEWDASKVLSGFEYSLTDNATGRFSIDSSTGEITVLDGSLLDYNTNTSQDITVAVSDANGNNFSKVTTVQINNLAPHDLLIAATSSPGLNVNTDGGNNAYLIADDGGDMLGGLAQLSFEIQFTSNPTTAETPLLSYATSSNHNELLVSIAANGNLSVLLAGDSTTSTAIDYRTLHDGSQHQIGLSWDNAAGDLLIYIDGVQVDSITNFRTDLTIGGNGKLVFGQVQDIPDGEFDFNQIFAGTFHNIRLFSDIRTSTEFANSFASPLPHDEGGMLAQWSFNKNTSNTTIFDSVYGSRLTLARVNQTGFTDSTPELELTVQENELTGTVIGRIAASDSERAALVTSLLENDLALFYNEQTGKFYQLTNTSLSWGAANSNAQSSTLNGVNGQLVTVTSAYENQYLTSILVDTGQSRAYLRGSDATAEGEWRWGDQLTDRIFWQGGTTGDPTDNAFQNWQTSDPDNLGSQHYSVLLVSGNWTNQDGSLNERSFIQYDANAVLANAGPIGEQPLIYTIATQTIAGAFSIDPATGQISVANGLLLDYETNDRHSITVRATDTDNNSSDKDVIITLTDLTEKSAVPISISSGIELNTGTGNSAYLSTTSGSSILGGLSKITLESTVALVGDQQQIVMSYSTSTYSNAMHVQIQQDGNLILTIADTPLVLSGIDYQDAMKAGELHSLAISWNSTYGEVLVYVDGQHVDGASGFARGVVLDTDANNSLTLGTHTESPSGGFNSSQIFRGSYYDFRIWNEIRSQAEISLNYSHKTDPDNPPTGLIANWQMDNINASDHVLDTVNGNHLVIGQATGAGFYPAIPTLDLSIDENSVSGSSVGYVVATPGSFHNDIVDDGRFMNGPASNRQFSAGQSVGGWQVLHGSIDLNAGHSSPLGGNYIQLSGTERGSIGQDLDTQSGRFYQVVFSMSGPFNKPEASKSIRISANGQTTDFHMLKPNGWVTPTNMLWEHRTFNFRANSSLTALSFESLDAGDHGPHIADVRVIELPDAVNRVLNSDSTLSFDAITGKFYRLVDTTTDFNTALNAATGSSINGVSGQLATVDSSAENRLLQQYAISAGNSIWLGASDANTEGNWNWLDGNTESARTFWTGGSGGSNVNGIFSETMNLSDSPGENALRLSANGEWADDALDSNHAYVIEWNAMHVLGKVNYALTDDADGRFSIAADSGEVFVADGTLLDHEYAQTHAITVNATNLSGSYSQPMTVTVTDSHDAPTDLHVDDSDAWTDADQVTTATAGAQRSPVSASLTDGKYVTVWYSNAQTPRHIVYGQIFNQDGTSFGSVFVVNTDTDHHQYIAQVSATTNGGFVVSWLDYAENGEATNLGSHAQMFDANGLAIGVEIDVNSSVIGSQRVSDIAGTDDGGFVLTWSASGNDADGGSVVVRKFDANGTAVTPEILVNTTVTGQQTAPRLSATSNGGFAVTWMSENLDGDGYGIAMQRFSATGAFLGGETQVNTTNQGQQLNPDIVVRPDGKIAVAWETHESGNVTLAYRLFNSDGTAFTSELRLSSHAASVGQLVAEALPNNGIALGWRQNESGNLDILLAIIDEHGNVTANDLNIAPLTESETDPAITLLGNGKLLLNWTDLTGLDGSSAGIFQRHYNYAHAEPTVAENAVTTTQVGSVTGVTDRDLGDTFTFALTDDANGRFTIDHTTGAITVANGSLLDHETSTSHSITIQVTDSANNTYSEVYSIVLSDSAEPAQAVPGSQTVSEDAVLIFSSANGNALTVEDTIAAIDVPIQVSLSVNDAVLSLSQLTGITIVEGNNGTSAITFNGTQAAINAALDGLTVTPASNFNGSVSLTMTTTLDTGLAGRYTFDTGEPLDSSAGSAQHGIRQGNAITTVDPERGTVLSLDGTDTTNVLISGRFDEPTSLTMAGWVSLNTPDTNGAQLIALGTDAGIRLDKNGSLHSYIHTGGGLIEANHPIAIAGDGWHHVAASFDGTSGTLTLFIDGKKASSTISGFGISYNTTYTDSYIGALGGSISADFNGLIDDARVYSRSLAADEIAALASDRTFPTDTIAIAVTAVNDPPQLSVSAGGDSYTERSAGTYFDNTLTITDIDSSFDGSTITTSISNNSDTGDQIFVRAGNSVGLSGNDINYNYGNGPVVIGEFTGGNNSNPLVVTFNSNSNAASVEATGQQISYRSEIDNPSNLQRTLEMTVSDSDGGTGNPATRVIDVIPGNEAPILASIETATLNHTENASATTVSSAITLSDIDDVSLETAVVKFDSGYVVTEDVLSFTSQNGITGSYDAPTGVLTLSGSATIAHYEQALRSITYTNSSDAPNTAIRTLSFVVNDGKIDSNPVTRDLSISPVNDTPLVATIESSALSYTEKDGPVPITGSLTLSDLDNNTLTSAIVKITNGLQSAEDVLAFSNTPAITGNWNNSTGTLTLSGTDSVANYQSALRSVSYENTSDNPNTSSRTVTFSVNDGDTDSNPQTRNLSITRVNDTPQHNNIESTGLAYTEGDGPVAVTTTLSTSDPDDTLFESAVVHITGNFSSTEDILGFTDQNGISASYNDSTGVLTLTGSATVAHYRDALRSVTYENISDDPATSTRTVSFSVNDGDADSVVTTRDISVSPVNDAPEQSLIESNALSYTENDSAKTITSAISVADPDDSLLESANISISSNFVSGEDQLSYTDRNGITGNYNATTGVLVLTGSATLTDYQNALRSVNYHNTSEHPDTSPRTISFTISDGNENSHSVSRDITIAAINDAPVATIIELNPLAYIENSVPIPISSTLTLSDVDNSNIDSASVKITGNYTSGEDLLEFTAQNGIVGNYNSNTGEITLSGNSSIANYLAAIRSITYANNSDAPNTATRELSITVNDGTADSNTLTRSVEISPINDAPSILNFASSPVSYTENTSPVAISSFLLLSDSDDTNIESASVKITANFLITEDVLGFTNQNGISGNFDSANGEMLLSGSSTIANYQNAIRSITYSNTSDNPDNTNRQLSITVNDGNTDSNTATLSIAVIPLNDAPQLSSVESTPAAYTENDIAQVISSTITVGDPEDTSIESATVQITGNFFAGEDRLSFTDQDGISGSYDATIGEMTLTGTASLADYQSALRSVSYLNNSDIPETETRTISFVINDGAADSNLQTRELVFTATNDSPVVSAIENTPVLISENSAGEIVTSALSIFDIDDTNIDSASIRISGNYISSEDELAFSDQNGISGNFNSLTGEMVLNGSASLSNYETAIRTITYRNVSENPDLTDRTITIAINDGDADSNTLTRDIVISPVNDAPLQSAIESTPVSYSENSGPVVITSTLVMIDLDDTNLEYATVQITGNHKPLEDQLGFVNQRGISGAYDSVSGRLVLNGSATVADYQAALRSVTYENTGDNPGTSIKTITFTINDGDSDGNTQTREITINPINDAPVQSSIESTTIAFTENDAGLPITGTLSLDDLDDTHLESATVSVTGMYVMGEDVLSFTNQNGISGFFDVVTGELALTGTSTLANYASALRSVTYTNISDDPDTATRTLAITVNDGSVDSNTLTREVSIVPRNDAPILHSIENGSLAYTENDSPAIVSQTITLQDADNLKLNSASAAITSNFTATEDVLAIANQNGITANYDSDTGVLSLSGTASIADYELALRSITYSNTDDNPVTTARTVTFTVNDDNDNSNTQTRDIIISRSNDASVQSSIETSALSYIENDAPVPITSSLTLSDVDDTNIESATIRIANSLVGSEDVLAFENTASISGIWDNSSGMLTLTGTDTIEAYQNALRSVTYHNSSDNPDITTRQVVFSVNDGDTDSAIIARQIEITALNDAPVEALIETTALAYTENDGSRIITNQLILSELDDGNLESAVIQITEGYQADQDVLAYFSTGSITGNWIPATGELILTGTDTVAAWQQALRSVTYANTSDNPIDDERTISITVNDGDANSNTVRRDVVITPINDAPVTGPLEATALSYLENAAGVALTSALELSDLDDTDLEHAVVTISTGFTPQEDLLTFVDTATITGTWNADTGQMLLRGSDSISAYQEALSSVTYENTSDNPSLAPRTLGIAVNDGDDNSNLQSRTLLIHAINDAPSGSDTTVTMLEDTQYTFNPRDFGFTDSRDLHELNAVIVDRIPSTGRLLLGSVAVNNGQIITTADIESGILTFTPTEHENGPTYDTLVFRVRDDGGIANEGINTSFEANTLTVDVLDVNDAPAASDNTVLTPEDTDHVFHREDFLFTDVLDNNEFEAITISSLPSAGVLTLNGSVVEIDQLVTTADIDSGLLIYTPPLNEEGNGYNGFGFHVHDNGGTSNGGISIDPTSNFISFNVPGVNDAPLLVAEGSTVDEGSDNTITTALLSGADADDLLPHELTFTLTTAPGNGELLLNGKPLFSGSTFTLAQIADEQLRYRHDGSETESDFFDVSLADGGEDGAQPAIGRFSLVINEVIDAAPVLDNDELKLEFGEPFDSDNGDLLLSGFSSLSSGSLLDNSAFLVEIESPPSHGTVGILENGTFTYSHDGSSFLDDKFSYRVTNEDGVFTIATVSISVEPPVASAFSTKPPAVALLPTVDKPQVTAEAEKPEQPTEEAAAEEEAPTPEEQYSEAAASQKFASEQRRTTSSLDVFRFLETDPHTEATVAKAAEEIMTEVEHHSAVRATHFVQQDIKISNLSFQVVFEVQKARAQDVVANPSFLQGLSRLESELEESEKKDRLRYTLENETIFGVSISATAGALAWALRGGALFASVMASTPLWTSIDPMKAVASGSSSKKDEDYSLEDKDVEYFFSSDR